MNTNDCSQRKLREGKKINYAKLIDALRWTANEYKGSILDEDDKDTMRAAADAIEELRKVNRELTELFRIMEVQDGK